MENSTNKTGQNVPTLPPNEHSAKTHASRRIGRRASRGASAEAHAALSPDLQKNLQDRQTVGRLRRSTLVALRWTAVIGQLMAILITVYGLKFDLFIAPCLMLIGASALLNIWISTVAPLDRRVSDREAIAQLTFDILQLGALLYFTGGLQNPFALLFIAPAVTSATTLRPKVVWACLGVTAVVSGLLLFFHQPLPWTPNAPISDPFLLTIGTSLALGVGIVFTSLYAWRAAGESRRMSNALAATEAVLAQEQKLAALGGMAAAAAHELGTPLATIQVIAKEMSRELPGGTPLGEDARLMLSQAQRCREILLQLAQRGDEGEPIHDRISIESLLKDVTAPFEFFERDITLNLAPGEHGPNLPLKRMPEMIYSLTNIVENAVDFSRQTVDISVRWSAEALLITVNDDGPGFDPVIRTKLGEPYISSRASTASVESSAGGLGLGFFIAKTLVERLGGSVAFGNHRDRAGAFVSLTLPREAVLATGPNY